MNPTVSVIIPLYNAEATLDRCLESILSQSLRDIEVLCIDDASTDGSADVLKRWAAQDGRVRIRHFSENRGTLIAIKAGLLNANGKYVMFCDADDRYLPGAIENAARQIEESGADILQFGIRIDAPPGTDLLGFEKFFPHEALTSEGVSILYDCYLGHRVTHNYVNKIARREICRAVAETMPEAPIRRFMDLYMMFFFLYYAKTLRGVPDIYYEYTFGTGVSTSGTDAKHFEKVCMASRIPPAIGEFLRQRNEYETYRFLLETIETTLKVDVVNKLLTLPEITRETVDLAVTSWGPDVIYEFLKMTGLFSVKCKSRYMLIPALMNQIIKEKQESAS